MLTGLFPLLFVIIIYSIFQSVFGVGLLVFGTPTLLLMGYPFETVLNCLLPCSIVISSIQVFQGWKEIGAMRIIIPLYVLPCVVLGLVMVLMAERSFNIRLFMGLVMLLIGMTRITKNIKYVTTEFISKHIKSCLVVTGLIHGATNLGGGPLTLTINSVFSQKEAIRANIAYGYLLMASIQMAVMISMGKAMINGYTVILPAISVIVYLLLGNKIFQISTQLAYYHLMTVLIFVFGFCLLVTK